MLVIQMEDPMEGNNQKIYQTVSSEHLELDLISSSSINSIKTQKVINDININSDDNTILKSYFKTNDNHDEHSVNMSYQNTDTAFLNLARCLEEHAKLFFAAENIAINRAIEQRNALLDALINALKSYEYNDEIQKFSDSDAENSFIQFVSDNDDLSLPKSNSIVNGLLTKNNLLEINNQRSLSFISNKSFENEL